LGGLYTQTSAKHGIAQVATNSSKTMNRFTISRLFVREIV
jgi:hypothetical protein